VNPAYDDAIRRFVERLLQDDVFVRDVAEFCARLGPYGAVNGLGQTLLRTSSPGVPDTYQGCELWNQSFVDPDNRQPVDFDPRRAFMRTLPTAEDVTPAFARSLLDHWTDGAVKLFVLTSVLRTRVANKELFLRGDYDPILVGEHVVSFVRRYAQRRVVVVVPRFSYRLTLGERMWPLGDIWGTQTLPVPSGRYRNEFTGQIHDARGFLRLADVLSDFPVALLNSSDQLR